MINCCGKVTIQNNSCLPLARLRSTRQRATVPGWGRGETIQVDRITVLHADGYSPLRPVGEWGISCLEYFWELPHSVAVECELLFFFFFFFTGRRGQSRNCAISFFLAFAMRSPFLLAFLSKQPSTIPTVGKNETGWRKKNIFPSFRTFSQPTGTDFEITDTYQDKNTSWAPLVLKD